MGHNIKVGQGHESNFIIQPAKLSGGAPWNHQELWTG